VPNFPSLNDLIFRLLRKENFLYKRPRALEAAAATAHITTTAVVVAFEGFLNQHSNVLQQ